MTQTILEGVISIEAAIRSGSRPVHALTIRHDLHDRDIGRLVRLAHEQRIPVERADDSMINPVAQGRSHGGVIAQVGERRYAPLETLISGAIRPFIVMLDGVEDPFNFGQAIRAIYAAGAHGLVVRPRSWENAAGVVARASAGASEWITTAVADSAEAAAAYFRKQGLTIAVTDKERAVSIYEADLTQPLFLLIGGERRGVTRSFADSADMRLKIPYGRDYGMSLGTTGAASVLAFEVMRQRLGK
jgi:23S rRNA (guanosine2251-2'-O)-methyltransferase